MLKKIREGHTVSFKHEDITLYGVIEKIENIEEETYYTIYANGKLYKHVEKNLLINDYGVIDD